VFPDRADTEHITATYDKGILEVSVPVPQAKAEGRRIEITKAS
jgi:HSP20 family molecular chaperone IbpA